LLKPSKYPAFEIGHMIIEKNGKMCGCGQKGCFEAYSSMKALKDNIRKKIGITKNISGKEALQIIKDNTEEVKDIISEFIFNLSIGIRNLSEIFAPEVVSIGGSLAYYEEVFLTDLQKKVEKSNLYYTPKIVVAEFKNDAGLIGSTIK
jgi:glucokinase